MTDQKSKKEKSTDESRLETKGEGGKKNWRFHLRALNSMFIAFSAIVLIVNSIALYFAPSCGVAQRTGWTLLGLSKESWSNLHVIFGFAILLPISYHVYLNWRAIRGYVRKKAVEAWELRAEGLAAFIVVFGLFIFILSSPQAATTISEFGKSLTMSSLTATQPPANTYTPVAPAAVPTEECEDCSGEEGQSQNPGRGAGFGQGVGAGQDGG